MSVENSKRWSDIEEVGVYWLMRVALFLRLLLGGALFRVVLFPVVTYYFLMSKQARRASLDYLLHLEHFAPNIKVQANTLYVYKHFLSFGQSIIDKLAAWNGCISMQDIVVHGGDAFSGLIERNEGAMILGAHLGNNEVSRALASIDKGVKLNILVHTRHARNFNRLLDDVSKENCMELIQVTELTPAIAIILEQKVSQGEFVFIVGDRVPVNSDRILQASFLGEPAFFAQGPFILASLLKCPVYTLFCLRHKNKYHIYFELFAERISLPRKNRMPTLQKYVELFSGRLEKYCLLAPLQWFNFYHYWLEEAGKE